MDKKIVKVTNFVEYGMPEEMMADAQKSVPPPWKDDKAFRFVSKSIPRTDGYDIVSGTAQYTTDIRLPRMLIMRTLNSPHAAARIRSIDASEAMKLNGVVSIMTYENAPDLPWQGYGKLLDRHVRHEGDEVAVVAAENLYIAEEAIGLIKVDYEILPHVVDAEDAMKPDAPKVRGDGEGNILRGKPSVYTRGDAEKGLKEADVVVEGTFKTAIYIHTPTEPHNSVANWEGDNLTVWDSTQAVFGVRQQLAGYLQMPLNKVRVIKNFMGGGFGSKLGMRKYTLLAALIARETGRPVKSVNTRQEEFLRTGNRPDSVQKVKVGAKKDGTLTAIIHESFGAVGAFPGGADSSAHHRNVYKCANVSTSDTSVLVNAGQSCPFRAPNVPQSCVSMDQAMDMLAEKLNMDPLELRLKNYADVDQTSNLPYTSKFLRECYEEGAKLIGWERRNKKAGSGRGTKKRGIGMATAFWWGGGGPSAHIIIKLNSDGTASLLSGTQDIGTGTRTYMAQIAAEELGINMEDVSVTLADTQVCPYGPTSGGSVTTPSCAPAVKAAAYDVKKQLLEIAATMLEVPAENLDLEPGKVIVKNNPAKSVTIKEVARKMGNNMIVGHGFREENPSGYSACTFGAQFAEVEVDTSTGNVKVIKLVAAHDSGRMMNITTAENQVQGAVIQGIGMALTEERIMDKKSGKMLNASYGGYHIPTIDQIPEIVTYFVNKPDNTLNHAGVKGLGEPPHVPTAAAIANAVYNAIGKRIYEIPITPDRVLKALG